MNILHLKKILKTIQEKFLVIDNKLDKVIENQECIIKQNEEMLKILNKQN